MHGRARARRRIVTDGAGRGARRRPNRAPRLDDMAVDRIDVAALYPTFGLMIQGVTEREPALALCRAINDWVAEYCVARPGAPDRRRDAADDRRRATRSREARRCIEEHGFRGVWRRPEHFGTLPRLQDEAYEPLWSYLEDVDVPFAHPPGHERARALRRDPGRFDDYYSAAARGALRHRADAERSPRSSRTASSNATRACASRSSRPARCGRCRTLHRLDEHLELFGFDRGALTMKPSDYFRRQCFVSVEEVEPGLADDAATSTPTRWCSRRTTRTPTARSPAPPRTCSRADRARRRHRAAVLRDNALPPLRPRAMTALRVDVFEADRRALRATRVYADARPIYRDERPDTRRSSPPPRARAARATPSRGSSCSSPTSGEAQAPAAGDAARGVRRRRRAAGADARAARSTAPGVPSPGTRRSSNIPNVGAIVFVFWNPDRGIRMQGEYEENPDGTLRATRDDPGRARLEPVPGVPEHDAGRARARRVVAVHHVLRACASRGQGSCCTCRRACSSSARCSSATATSRSAARAASRSSEVVHLERLGGALPAMTTIPRIVSADDHVVEPPDVFTSRLPAKYRDVGPRVVRTPVAEMTFRGGKYAYAMGDERRRPARRLVALRRPAPCPHTRLARVRGLRARRRAGRRR